MTSFIENYKVLGTNIKIENIRKLIYETLVINLEDTKETTVYVGTDSQQRGRFTKYVSAIAIHTVGKGGRVFYKQHNEPRVTILRDRLLKEAQYSIEVAQLVSPVLTDFEGYALEQDKLVDLEVIVHADVNSKKEFASNAFMKEITGYVTGMGYTCVCKPDSPVASFCADRMTKV